MVSYGVWCCPTDLYSVWGVCGAYGVLQCLMVSVVVPQSCTVSEVRCPWCLWCPTMSYGVCCCPACLYSVRVAYGVLQCLMVSVAVSQFYIPWASYDVQGIHMCEGMGGFIYYGYRWHWLISACACSASGRWKGSMCLLKDRTRDLLIASVRATLRTCTTIDIAHLGQISCCMDSNLGKNLNPHAQLTILYPIPCAWTLIMAVHAVSSVHLSICVQSGPHCLLSKFSSLHYTSRSLVFYV